MDDSLHKVVTLAEYIHMQSVILILRNKLQKARECLEKNAVVEALEYLRKADDDSFAP